MLGRRRRRLGAVVRLFKALVERALEARVCGGRIEGLCNEESDRADSPAFPLLACKRGFIAYLNYDKSPIDGIGLGGEIVLGMAASLHQTELIKK